MQELRKLAEVIDGKLGILRDRETELNLYYHYQAIILGLGGIGSWLAWAGAHIFKRFILIDPDKVEVTNLHRTPYTAADVGRFKVYAAAKLIIGRNPGATVVPIPERVESIPDEQLIQVIGDEVSLVLDCRDNITPLPKPLNKYNIVKLGYDGLKFNIIVNPDYEKIMQWDTAENGYQITPSAIAPPMILAALIVQLIQNSPPTMSKAPTQIISGDVNELLDLILEKFTVVRQQKEEED